MARTHSDRLRISNRSNLGQSAKNLRVLKRIIADIDAQFRLIQGSAKENSSAHVYLSAAAPCQSWRRTPLELVREVSQRFQNVRVAENLNGTFVNWNPYVACEAFSLQSH